MYDYDDIDRALFSLQLEEPPEDLRASILATTVHAPAEVRAVWPLSLLETSCAGAVLAVAVCLAIGILTGQLSSGAVTATLHALAASLANPTVLAWLGAGASAAICLSLTNLTPILAGVRQSRA